MGGWVVWEKQAHQGGDGIHNFREGWKEMRRVDLLEVALHAIPLSRHPRESIFQLVLVDVRLLDAGVCLVECLVNVCEVQLPLGEHLPQLVELPIDWQEGSRGVAA